MIVSPDFPDHWKVAMLMQMTDTTAGFCVLRFWAHCQNRRTWRFQNMTPQVLAAVCKWGGDPQKWWDAMAQTFIDVTESEVIAHQWDEYNSALIAAWERGQYGKLGGRNRKAGRRKAKTSKGGIEGALEEPDKSREEKSRVDGIGEEERREEEKDAPAGGSASPMRQFTDGWMEAFHSRFGEFYRFQKAKDGVAAADLLKVPEYTPERLLKLAKAAWNLPPGFLRQQALTIAGLSGKFVEIREELNGSQHHAAGPTQDNTTKI